MIAFTFDDGPDPSVTKSIFDIFEMYNIKTTFFVLGRNIDRNPAVFDPLLRSQYNRGHRIASHSYTHQNFTTLSESQIISEITKTENSIQRAIGVKPGYFRYPYISSNSYTDSIVSSFGYKIAYISYDSDDWKTPYDPELVFSNYKSYLNSINPQYSSVISLQHDIWELWLMPVNGYPNLLSGIIEYTLSKGFTFVTIDQCTNDAAGAYR
jgi:peptidoglycan/xylan/chitin deacetylase (PgdA/CDA1 family)